MGAEFKFLVEYDSENGTMSARFTNEKHAKNFARRQKKDGVAGVRLFEIDNNGNKVKELKSR